MRLAGDTGRRAVDAWQAFKAFLADAAGYFVAEAPKQSERDWRTGYDAARAAKAGGKPTPRAPRGVDPLSFTSGAVEGAAAGGRDLNPKDVLADLFGEELPLDDPMQVAEIVIQRLRDAGFVIWPGVDPSASYDRAASPRLGAKRGHALPGSTTYPSRLRQSSSLNAHTSSRCSAIHSL